LRLRYHHHDGRVVLCAFDLIELNGDDLRREPLVTRKATLASVVAKASPGILLNEHFEHDGPTVFAHACKLGLEGIVSKRKGLDLSLRPDAGLARVEEPRVRSSAPAGGRGLGQVAVQPASLPRT
jgi:ATP-dependent DNA ligase